MEASPEDLLSLAQQLPDHLAGSAEAETAGGLAKRLSTLLDSWEDMDGGVRVVGAVGVGYFLRFTTRPPTGLPVGRRTTRSHSSSGEWRWASEDRYGRSKVVGHAVATLIERPPAGALA